VKGINKKRNEKSISILILALAILSIPLVLGIEHNSINITSNISINETITDQSIDITTILNDSIETDKDLSRTEMEDQRGKETEMML